MSNEPNKPIEAQELTEKELEGNPIPDITNEQKLLGRGLQPKLDALIEETEL